MSMKIHNPTELGQPHGYNHGVEIAGGRLLFVAGQTGVGDAGVTGSFPTQFARALRAVRRVVEMAGGGVEHIGRLTIYVRDIQQYVESREELATTYAEEFGRHYPAMSMIEVKGLLYPDALVEIEATAVLP